jgi:hypothetical protein
MPIYVPASTRKNTEVHADFTPPKKAAAVVLKVPGADIGNDSRVS